MRGYDFEGELDLQAMLDAMMTSGFQATAFGWDPSRAARIPPSGCSLYDGIPLPPLPGPLPPSSAWSVLS